MIEVKVKGDWPKTAPKDIYKVCEKVREFNLDNPRTLLVGPKHLLNNLDAQYGHTTWSYATFLKKAGGFNDIMRLDTDDSFAMFYAYTINLEKYPKIGFRVETIKIIGIKSLRTSHKLKEEAKG